MVLELIQEARRYCEENGTIKLCKQAVRRIERNIHDRLVRYNPSVLVYKHRILRLVRPKKCTDADPLKLLWIDPEDIEHYLKSGSKKFGRVQSGEWDMERGEFNDLPQTNSFHRRFVENKSWEETELFHLLLDKPDDMPWVREYDTPEEALQHLQNVERTYESIKTHGYKTQRSLLTERREKLWKQTNDGPHPILNEIGVNIGRNGTLLWKHRGLHRLAIAQFLGLDTVPVYVLTRHKEWQSIRNSVRRLGTESIDDELVDHPDLQDILNDGR